MGGPSMSHVDLKKCPCRPVDFRGLGPVVCYVRGVVVYGGGGGGQRGISGSGPLLPDAV